MTGLCLSRRTVLCTPHALMFQPGSSFCISVQERFFLFAHLPPRCTSMSLIWSLPRSLTLRIKVLLLEFEQVFLCELHTPPPLFSGFRGQRSPPQRPSVETVSKRAVLRHLIWCSPFRQGWSPKNFLVKIRLGYVLILRKGERSGRENCDRVDSMPQQELTFKDWVTNFLLQGVSGAVSKTLTAPIERVKLVIQTQNANPKIRSGEVPRYTGKGNCFSRIYSEQGAAAFWRVNFTNCIRYFPTQAFNLSFKDSIKIMFPKYRSKQDFGMFFAVNMASGALAAAGSLTIVYPLDYARTRLASNVGSEKKTFDGLFDWF